jgi:hypothetical protein
MCTILSQALFYEGIMFSLKFTYFREIFYNFCSRFFFCYLEKEVIGLVGLGPKTSLLICKDMLKCKFFFLYLPSFSDQPNTLTIPDLECLMQIQRMKHFKTGDVTFWG